MFRPLLFAGYLVHSLKGQLAGEHLLQFGPLLVEIGFPAMGAVMVALILQSTPVSNDAVGTPILIGVNSGLKDSPIVQSYIAEQGTMLYKWYRRTSCPYSRYHRYIYSSIYGDNADLLLRKK